MAGDNDKKGFSGLLGLVSEISDLDESTKQEATPSGPKPESQAQRETNTLKSGRQTTNSPSSVNTVSADKNTGRPSSKWILVGLGISFAIIIGAFWEQNNRNAYPPPSLSSSQRYSSPQHPPAPAITTPTPSSPLPNYNRPVPSVTNPSVVQSLEVQYTKPSVGTNNVLITPEIRWCIREQIRIEAIRGVNDTNVGINEFNRLVDDYNRRCGSYRYRQGSLEQAKRDVEPYRSQIVADAIREARPLPRSVQPSPPSVSPNAPTNNAPEKPNPQHVKEAQQLLADLGYKPGPVDGGYGRRTADAVKAFQHDVGITQDGRVDQDLLSILRRTANLRTINIEGKYEYVDTGMRGGFTIKKEGVGYAIELHMVSINAAHLCEFGGKSKLEGNVLNFDASYDYKKAGVRIVFSSTGAELEDIGGARNSWCGLRAWMSGNYIKTVQ